MPYTCHLLSKTAMGFEAMNLISSPYHVLQYKPQLYSIFNQSAEKENPIPSPNRRTLQSNYQVEKQL
jgi:hypothetical protein